MHICYNNNLQSQLPTTSAVLKFKFVIVVKTIEYAILIAYRWELMYVVYLNWDDLWTLRENTLYIWYIICSILLTTN